MILDVDGEMLLPRLERHTFRYRPGDEDAVALEAEVVVEAPRVVSLHDEARSLRLGALAAEWLGCLAPISLSLVLGKLLAHRDFSSA